MAKKKPPISSLSEEDRQVRLRKIILAALGKAWMYWPPRLEVKKRCAVPGEAGWFFCEMDKSHKVEKLVVDHIDPIVRPSDGFTNWDDYINRRFETDPKKLQGLCTKCNKIKTNDENRRRREMKKCAKTAKTTKENA